MLSLPEHLARQNEKKVGGYPDSRIKALILAFPALTSGWIPHKVRIRWIIATAYSCEGSPGFFVNTE